MSDVQRSATPTESVKPSEIAASLKAGVTKVHEEMSQEIPRSLETREPSLGGAAGGLSETGKAVLEDIQRVTKDTQEVIAEKVQPAAEEAERKVSELTGKPMSKEAGEGRSIFSQELSSLMEQFKTGRGDFNHVAKLLFYSPNFRGLFLDLLGILQDASRDMRYTAEHIGKTEPKVEPVQQKTVEGGLEELQAKIRGEGEVSKPSATAGKGRQMSGEQVTQLSDRFVEWLRRVHDTPEFVEAFDFVNSRLSWIEGLEVFTVVFKDKSQLDQREQKLYEAAEQSQPVKVAIGAKVFLEHWIGTSLDPLFSCLNGIRRSVGKDEEAKGCLRDLSAWFRSCMKEPDFMSHLDRRKDEFKANLLMLRSKFIEKYRGEVDHLMQEFSVVSERAKKDELTVKLTSDVQELYTHLFKDESGNLIIKPELWSDLKTILPVFLRRLRFIQLPEICVKDESVDFLASGTTISVGELAPKRIQAHFYSDLAMEETDLAEAVGSEYDLQSLFIIEAGKIYAEARNIYFELNRKSFPPLSDAGMADLNIHGDDGMSLRLIFGARRIGHVFQPSVSPVGSGFHLLRAKCTIDQLDLRLHEVKHSWMYAVLGPLIRRQLKQRLEEEVEKYLMTGEWMETITSPETLVEALSSSAPQ